MDDLLTTKQLQELLQVDRITIYRMLHDGRLDGFKIGGQWRFSRQAIEAWLQERKSTPSGSESTTSSSGERSPSSEVLPLSCVDAIQGVCAEALDIAVVTVGLDGSPLTRVSNSCGFCDLILSVDKGRERCASAWGRLAGKQSHACHAGLLCFTAQIEVGGQGVAIAAGCQFTTRVSSGERASWQSHVPRLAAELGLSERDLQSAASTIRLLPPVELPRISKLLNRMADTFSELGQERRDLLGRLHHIAEVSKI